MIKVNNDDLPAQVDKYGGNTKSAKLCVTHRKSPVVNTEQMNIHKDYIHPRKNRHSIWLHNNVHNYIQFEGVGSRGLKGSSSDLLRAFFGVGGG